MQMVKCINKIRDGKGKIIGYTLQSSTGETKKVEKNSLKEAVRNGKIGIVNMTLTSDNRLVDKRPDTPSKTMTAPSKQNTNTESLLSRVKATGYTINTFDTDCGHKCYIASSPDNTKHIFIIPDDVKCIYRKDAGDFYFQGNNLHSYMSNIKGTLKVVGGKGLISARNLFKECNAQSIDLSSFDTSKVTDMSSMFLDCKVQSLDLSSFDTRNVKNMCEMFRECKAQSIDLSSFDTSNVTDMSEMFRDCKVQYIDLRSFNASSVSYMECMFYGCDALIAATDSKILYELYKSCH